MSEVEAERRWSLEGRVALVTGGSSGIGLAVAEEFVRLGASVLLVARDGARLELQVARLRDGGARARGIAADLSTAEGRARVMLELEESGAGLDVLVNNVGVNVRKPASSSRRKSMSESSLRT
jgi:Tropinone reductase 1